MLSQAAVIMKRFLTFLAQYIFLSLLGGGLLSTIIITSFSIFFFFFVIFFLLKILIFLFITSFFFQFVFFGFILFSASFLFSSSSSSLFLSSASFFFLASSHDFPSRGNKRVTSTLPRYFLSCAHRDITSSFEPTKILNYYNIMSNILQFGHDNEHFFWNDGI